MNLYGYFSFFKFHSSQFHLIWKVISLQVKNLFDDKMFIFT